ncbi:MAG: Gfo/Idh/MocA family oxidoreductase [Phycisphaeraceae bacterium]|nr:Gfo/Idh/MocA family oxidoreductase [Phycisphaeraceae bacterium]
MNTPTHPHITRRDFVKASTTAGFATLLASSLGNRAFAQGSDTIRVGLVGCGGRGIFAGISDCASSSPGVQITAVGDLFPERAQSAAERFKSSCERRKLDFNQIFKATPATTFSGWDVAQKVINSDVDMVIFATPPYFRPAQLKACVAAGKHAFVEKPVATDVVGTHAFIEAADAAKEKGLCVVAGTQMRRQPHLKALMQRFHDGAMGEIVGGQSVRFGGALMGHVADRVRKPEWSDVEWQIRRWLFYTWLSGDFIVEQHVHNLDLINWALQAHPVFCYAMGARQVRTGPAYGNIYDQMSVVYEYPNGVQVTHAGRQMDGIMSRNNIRLQGSKGRSIFDFGNAKITGDNPFTYNGPTFNPAVQQYADLISAIRKGQVINEGRQIAETTMTAMLGRISAYTGQAVKWDWVMKRSKLDLSPPQQGFGPAPERPVAIPGVTKLI